MEVSPISFVIKLNFGHYFMNFGQNFFNSGQNFIQRTPLYLPMAAPFLARSRPLAAQLHGNLRKRAKILIFLKDEC
jgi:hypothetical protein